MTIMSLKNHYDKVCEKNKLSKLSGDYFNVVIHNLASRGSVRFKKGRKSDGFYQSIKLNLNARQLAEFKKDRMVNSILD